MDYCRDFGCWDFAVPDTRFCSVHTQPSPQFSPLSTCDSGVCVAPAAVADARARLMELMKKKDALEAEIQILNAVSKPGPLVDEDGYPRGDMDVHAERITRSQLARLQNDHIAIMHQIEASLHVLHSRSATTAKPAETTTQKRPAVGAPAQSVAPSMSSSPQPGPPSISPAGLGLSVALSPLDAFYLCDHVEDGSPAKEAGLCIGDKILQFGSILKRNQAKPGLGKALQDVVGACRDTPIKVVVYRNGDGILDLHLIPRQWAGRGLLGCKLVPSD